VRQGRANFSAHRAHGHGRRWFTVIVALVILGAMVSVGLPMVLSRYHRTTIAAVDRKPSSRQVAEALQTTGEGRLSPESAAAGPSPAPAPLPSSRTLSSNAACGPVYTYRSESWPNCSNTGTAAGSSLVHRSGNLTITRNGTVIDHVELNGSLDIHANNVTVENSVIYSSNWWGIFQRPGHSGLKVLHDTIRGVAGRGPDSGGEDIGVWNLGGSAVIAYDNISEFGGDLDILMGDVYDNYIHTEQAFGSEGISGCDPLPKPIPYKCYNHSNAFGIDTGHYITLRHNTILQAPIPGADSALELDDDLGTISHVSVIDNYVAGGNYCTYAASSPSLAPSTYVVYKDNAFSSRYHPDCGFYGPVAYWSSRGKGNKWSGNYWVGGRHAGRPITAAEI
jgi:hypothetical protein